MRLLMQMTEANPLFEYAARRDAEAFASIVNQYQRLVFATCRRKLHDPADLDDAVQETFLRLAQQASKLRSNVGGWLHRCAVNVAIDLNRRATTRERHESAAAARRREGQDDARQALVELREHLDEALKKLDAEQRELIVQRYFVGRTQLDLAREAGMSPATITNRLEHAINALRGHLSRMGCTTAAAGGAATVGALLEAETASAAVPATLTANLMKIGLSGVTSQSVGWTIGMLFTSLTGKIVLGTAGLAAVIVGIWIAIAAQTSAPRPLAQTPPATQTSPALTVQSGPNPQVAGTVKWDATTQPAPRRGVLSGRVVDRSGKPLGGATITLTGRGTLRGITDPEGFYIFDSVPQDGQYRIGVSIDGFFPVDPLDAGAPGLQLTSQAQARRDFVLDRGVPVQVMVTDDLEIPITNAMVDYNIRTDARNARATRMRVDSTGIALFVLPVSSTAYVVVATANGYAPGHTTIIPTSIDPPLEVPVRLGRGITVEGLAICNDGKPAVGWGIRARPDWWASAYLPNAIPIGPDGKFTLANMGPGEYTLELSKPIGDSASTGYKLTTVTLPPPVQPLRVDVPEPSPLTYISLTGKARFIGGRPSSVSIQAYSFSGEAGTRANFFNARIPSRGQINADEASYELKMPPGTYRLSFESPSIERKVIENFQVPGELPVVDLKVKSNVNPRLTGTVIDAASGQPVTHFAVRVTRSLSDRLAYGQTPQWIQISEPQGKFDIELPGVGIFQAQASVEGYPWTWSPEIKADKNGETVQTRIALARGGALKGQVLDPAGKPVAGAKVIARSAVSLTPTFQGDRFESEDGAILSDAEGRFVFSHLVAGEEMLKVIHRDFAPLISSRFKVLDGQSNDIGTLTFNAGGTVEGTVYDAQGRPAVHQTLYFQDGTSFRTRNEEETGRFATVSTDEQGRYRVPHMPLRKIFVGFPDRWEAEGVVRRTIFPVEGKTTRLDFGGTAPVKGKLLHFDKPMAETKVILAVRHYADSPVIINTTTGKDGSFTIFGPPPGKYALFAQASGTYVKIREIEVSGQPTDLGDVVDFSGEVQIKISADDPADIRRLHNVGVQTNIANQLWQDSVGNSKGDPSAGELIRVSPVPMGGYRISSMVEPDYAYHVPFVREKESPNAAVSLHLPRASAKLTVRLAGFTGDEPQELAFLRDDKLVAFGIRVTPSQPSSKQIPPGTYRLMEGYFGGPSGDIEPITLKEGESREIEIHPTPQRPPMTSIRLRIWSADGLLVPSIPYRVLNAQDNPIPLVQDTGMEALFVAPAGMYRLVVERPGAPPFVQQIEARTGMDGRTIDEVATNVFLP